MRTFIGVVALAVAVSCTPAADGTCPDGDARRIVPSSPPRIDRDGDGLDDGFEEDLVRAHLPFLAHHPDDACPTAALVFRARPHPADARLVHVAFTQLFALDCGLNSHTGDNEAFGATIDPALPAPSGITALVAISHQGTPCERTTACGVCAGMAACDVVDDVSGPRPVLYSSKDKHAGAVNVEGGCGLGSCLDTCALPLASAVIPLVNAGEPDHPLTSDLTAAGLVDDAWPEELRNHDPWGGDPFGTAGVIAEDLVDDLLVPPACSCVR